MKNQKFAVTYIDTLNGIKSSESINPAELKFFLKDERNGEIVITAKKRMTYICQGAREVYIFII